MYDEHGPTWRFYWIVGVCLSVFCALRWARPTSVGNVVQEVVVAVVSFVVVLLWARHRHRSDERTHWWPFEWPSERP